MRIRLVDHKTTGDIERKRREPVDLANDPQMLTYAEVTFREHPEATVEVAHNTISTKHKARVLPIEWVPISRSRAEANWARQTEVIRKMVALAAAPPADWNDVACNDNACHDYGGCDFLPICALKTPMLGATKMTFDEEQASNLLRRLLAGPSEPPPAETPPPTEAAVEDVALLPPDAPTRMTPAPTEEAPAPKTKVKRAKASKVEAPTTEGTWEYQVDKVLETTDAIEAYLNTKGAEGWELTGFFDGIYAVFKRPRIT